MTRCPITTGSPPGGVDSCAAQGIAARMAESGASTIDLTKERIVLMGWTSVGWG